MADREFSARAARRPAAWRRARAAGRRSRPLAPKVRRQGLGNPHMARRIWRRRAERRTGGGARRGDGPHRRLQPHRRARGADVRPDTAGIRDTCAEAAPSPAHLPRRDPLVPGFQRTGRGLGPGLAADPRHGYGRPLPDHGTEGLDQRRRHGRLVLLSGADRHGEEARGDQLCADRHASARRRGAADPPDQRSGPVLRDLLHRGRCQEGRSRRRVGPGLDHRQAPAAARTPGHFRPGPLFGPLFPARPAPSGTGQGLRRRR